MNAVLKMDPPDPAPTPEPRRVPSAPPPLVKKAPPPAGGGGSRCGYLQREMRARLAVVRESPGEWFRLWEWRHGNGPSLFHSANRALFEGFERTTRVEGTGDARVYALYVRYAPKS